MDPFVTTFAPLVTLVGGALLMFILMQGRTRKPGSEKPARTETDRLLQLGFEKAPVGIGYVSSDGNWLQVNQRLLQLLGYERSDLIKTSLRELTHSDDRKREAGMMASVRAGRSRGFTMNKRLRKADGDYDTFRFSIARLGSGSYPVFECVIDNAAEETDLQNDLAAAFDAMPEISVVRIDPAGMVTNWNRGAEELFGYSAEEMKGKPWTRLHTAEGKSGEGAKDLAVAAAKGRFEGVENRRRKDESPLTIELVIVPQFRGRDLVGFIEVARDASLNHAAREYKTAYERVKRLSEEKIEALTESNEALRKQVDEYREVEGAYRETQERLRTTNRELNGRIKVFSAAVKKLIDQRKNLEETIRAHEEELRNGKSEELSSALPSDLEWETFEDDLPALLARVTRDRTGVLVFRSGKDEKRLTLRSGTIAACSSNAAELLLGQILIDDGKISEADRAKMIEVQEQTGIAFGRLLVLFDLLSEAEVQGAMEAKVHREIGQLLEWRNGEWAFHETEIESLQIVPVEVSVPEAGEPAGEGVPLESEPIAKKKKNRKKRVASRSDGRIDGSFVASSSVGSTKFHAVGCSSVKRIPLSSRISFRDAAEAEEQGFSACKRCVTTVPAEAPG